MSQQMSAEMQRILEQEQENFASLEVFSDWMPDDGDYTVLVTSYSCGEKEAEGQLRGWWRLGVQIQAPDTELDGREFGWTYRSNVPGFLKNAAAALAGKRIDNYVEAVNVLAGSVSWLLNVRVKTNNKGYQNVTVTKVVDKGEAAS